MIVTVDTQENNGRWDWRIVAEGELIDQGTGFANDNQALQVGLRRAVRLFNRSGKK